MTHINMHNVKREPQIFASSRITPGQTNGPAQTVVLTDGGVQSVLTSFTKVVEETISQPATTFITTRTDLIRVTDAAQFTSLQASESSASASAARATSAQKSSSSPSETSKAASKDGSSSNLGVLIPAIVVPVAAVLIASFLAFWFIMRRRHQRQLKQEPEFVMASKPEKTISRGNSNSSGHSSTRELVPMSKLEKEVAITTSEVRRSSLDMFPPKYSSADIGVARPMTPPDKSNTTSPKREKSFANFSSVRPNISHKSKLSQDRNNSGRSRSNSASTSRNMPPPRVIGKGSPPKSTVRGSPPGSMRGQMGQPPRPLRPDEQHLRVGSASLSKGPPPPIATNMNNGNRAAPPRALNPPTPTGAFNGASPISQYSPIVKSQFNLGAVASTKTSEPQHLTPTSLKTSNLSSSKGTDSPTDDNVLSHENMRIARLANSSRLGFSHSPVEPNFPSKGSSGTKALSPLAESHNKGDPTATSPRLPPPLTRDDMPPKPFARGLDSPAGGSSIYPSPSIGVDATPRLGAGFSTTSLPHSEHTIGATSSTGHRPRVSVVSQLSSDDEYVDADVDAKSDVSSLDEQERWDMESDRPEGSRLGTGYNGSGYGSVGMSPIDGPAGASSAGTGTTKPSIRDRDSEGPFVLSRY